MQNAPLDRTTWKGAVQERGISLASLAYLTRVSNATVYAYSRGARRPNDAWIRRVERVLGLRQGV